MRISSPEFSNHEMMPTRFTCEGEDINPPLEISDIPHETRSLALIVSDPDAPKKTWIHWVVFDIPVTNTIEEDSVPGTEGANDFSRRSYGGPCPPSGSHRYFFELYALDCMLNLKQGATMAEVEEAMEGHILAQAELIGIYQKMKVKV